jgi:hypothetical protein
MRNYGRSPNDSTIADMNTRQNNCARPNPDVMPNNDIASGRRMPFYMLCAFPENRKGISCNPVGSVIST